ncbi:MAG: RNA polymerase subunit sigma-70, partial [Lutibacter sp.]|nr:RNA polymerase subunit sigma-70 [Lutibacter sp.]
MSVTDKQFLNPEKWVSLHADYLFNYTISRLNDRDLAKDLVQDTFFSALK